MYETKREIEEGVKEFGSITALARESGIPYSTLWDRLQRTRSGKPKVGRPKRRSVKPKDEIVDVNIKTISMNDVLKPHDNVGKVLDVLDKIPSGKFIQDDILRQETGLSHQRWSRVRGSVRLAGYWFQCPDRSIIWSGDKRSIKKLEEQMKELI